MKSLLYHHMFYSLAFVLYSVIIFCSLSKEFICFIRPDGDKTNFLFRRWLEILYVQIDIVHTYHNITFKLELENAEHHGDLVDIFDAVSYKQHRCMRWMSSAEKIEKIY